MLSPIKRLGTETLVYGVMTVLGRFLTFLLVPFYTNIFSPEQYGVVAYLYSLIALTTIFFSYGMEAAYFKYASTGEYGNERQNFSTPLISLAISSAFLTGLLFYYSGSIGRLTDIPPGDTVLIRYAAAILLFDTLALIPFASLRLRHKAGLFAVVKLVNIVSNVGLNILFLAVLSYGVRGVFLAGLLSSLLTVFVLIPFCYRLVVINFSLRLWKELLKFGLPYVPAGIATLVLQVIDRPILRALTDNETVGIYQANYRLGIVMMLLVTTFDYAYKPFFLNEAKNPAAKELFARIATYFFIVMTAVWLVATLFVRDIVGIHIGSVYVIHPDYWVGLSIVPVILLAYMFTGWSVLLTPGIFIEKKTSYLPLITGFAAAINIGMNFLFIPMYGIHGAAFATLAAYVILAAGMYVVSQAFFRVRYERRRLSLVTLAFIVTGTAAYYTAFVSYAGITVRLIIFAAFPILLVLFGILNEEERRGLRKIIGLRG